MMMMMLSGAAKATERDSERGRAIWVLCCVFSFGFGCIFFSRNKEYTNVGANGLRIRTLWKKNLASRKSAKKAKPSQTKTKSKTESVSNQKSNQLAYKRYKTGPIRTITKSEVACMRLLKKVCTAKEMRIESAREGGNAVCASTYQHKMINRL